MINRLIDFSTRHRPLVFALVAAACVAGWWSLRHVPLDAIPDLSDTQVIIYSRWERSPDIIESQVTYPIVTTMLGAPRVKSVRGFSDFGYSYVYVIFEDSTDPYWARARTQEYLAAVQNRLPAGVATEIGPDATALGWIFQYALLDESGQHSLADLRSYQDWHLRYYLKSVPGVAEVAAVGGFGKQFQVNVDPNRLQAHNLSIAQVVDAVRANNRESAGRVIEFGGTEYMVRGRGYFESVTDIENLPLTASEGTPLCVRDIGQVVMGPDLRRGIAELDGEGEVVSGIVIMRHGQNALEVINRVKARLREIEPGLPSGVKVVPIYDRSELIYSSIDNLKRTLLEVIIVVMLVIFLFLWHVPSAIIPAITIPIAVLVATPTDPAPLSMLETVITLKPKAEWRPKSTWYSGWAPGWLKPVLRHVTPDHLSTEDLIDQMNAALQVPGLANGWTMPIKGRIEMLRIRTEQIKPAFRQ